jgi:predicted TIM-barrel fold metal-dependent hydrolase
MSADRRIVDFHCHVADGMCFPPSFRDGVIDNMALSLTSRGVPLTREKVAMMHAGTLRDPLCDELVREMDAAGITESVLLLPDFTYAMRDTTHSIEELIDHHRAVRERHPGRFRVFVGVDPRWGQAGIDLFEKAIRDYGFDGMKLYPPCGYRLDDRSLYPFYEICSAYSLPVLTHVGATAPALDFEIARPIFVDRPARDFPGIDFVLAHGTVAYAEECAMLCNNRPNVYIDVSGYEGAGPEGLRAVFSRGINHKILFGTDWPIFRMQGRQASFVQRLTSHEMFPESMSETDRELFFHGNADRLLAKNTLKNGSVMSGTATTAT